jgi:tripartite-type tricarboxylate transporter receptor subunit TctC
MVAKASGRRPFSQPHIDGAIESAGPARAGAVRDILCAPKGNNMTKKLTVLLFASICLAAAPAAAQTFPSRPIQLLVPLAPGSTTDAAARLLAQQVGQATGWQFVIENKPGASTMLASQTVAKAAPDGLTLLMGASALTVNQNLFKSVPYDAEKDFAAVSLLVTSPLVLVVNPKLGVKRLREFLAKYRDAKDLSFGSGGAGTMLHLAGEVFKIRSGIDMRHVPYRGGAPALTDVIAGHIQLMFGTPLIQQNIDRGDVVALAVTGTSRVEQLPDVPTFTEAGLDLPEVEGGAWFGLLAPAGTPKDVVDILNRQFNAVLKNAEVRKKLSDMGLVAKGTTPDEFGRFMRDEIKRWPPVFAAAGIKPE